MHRIIRTDAEADIAAGYAWYEEQREGLGAEFIEEVSSTLDAVQATPLRFPLTFRGLRRALVHRFPYGIFFLVLGETIVVRCHSLGSPSETHSPQSEIGSVVSVQ